MHFDAERKRNMKKKAIISAVLSAALLAAGALGGTIAYFSTKNEIDVNITSAKVSVTATVSDLKTFSMGEEQEELAFANGGGAGLSGQTITLDRMSPGDKVTFNVTVKNQSNIKVKYRIAFNKLGDLAPALETAVSGGASEWTTLFPNSEDILLNCSIEMPTFIGIEYLNMQGSVKVVVEAIQDNAYIPDTSTGYADTFEEDGKRINVLNAPAHFNQMITDLSAVDVSNAEALAAAKNTVYKLDGDIDLAGSSNINQGVLYGTLDGANHKIKNFEFNDSTATSAGLFAQFYDGAVVKNITIDNATLNGGENVGALFGQSYLHAHGGSSTVTGSELTVENVTIGSNVTINGNKGVGAIAGSTRWVEKLTLTNVVNNADVSAQIYNVGGFFGTLAGVKTLIATNCVNNGNIRGPHNVAGFVGQSPALTSITLTNCENHGRITDFSSNSGTEANAGFFVACKNSSATLNYSGNFNDGAIYYVTQNESLLAVFERPLVSDAENAQIKIPSGKTVTDYMILDNTIVLSYTIDSNNQFNISAVSGADHYTITMQVWGRDVSLSGNTATVYKEKYLACSKTYATVSALKSGFGRITRAGYFLNSTYTQYDYLPEGGISNSATMNGRANFFRLPYAQKATYAASHEFGVPSYDETLGEWVYLFDAEDGCEQGYGHILSPKNTTVSYNISAYDANGHVIANAIHYDNPKNLPGYDESGSFLRNMNGDEFESAAPNTTSGTTVYPDVA